MEFIDNLVSNSTFYYILIVILYIFCIILVVTLLVKNKRKKYSEVKVEPKKDIESIDLESVLSKMQDEVNKPKDEIMTFEEEQEEKAIISYQELLRAVNKNVNEVTKPREEVEEKTIQQNIDNVIEEKAFQTLEFEKEDNIKPIREEVKSTKFQNSEFISPIYGRVNNDVEYPKIKAFEETKREDDLEKTIVMPKVDSKFDNNDEFLRILKEFRNNLE